MHVLTSRTTIGSGSNDRDWHNLAVLALLHCCIFVKAPQTRHAQSATHGGKSIRYNAHLTVMRGHNHRFKQASLPRECAVSFSTLCLQACHNYLTTNHHLQAYGSHTLSTYITPCARANFAVCTELQSPDSRSCLTSCVSAAPAASCCGGPNLRLQTSATGLCGHVACCCCGCCLLVPASQLGC